MMQRITVLSVQTTDDSILDLADAKSYLRMSNVLEDSLIASQISSVRGLFERLTRRNLLMRQLMLTLDYIPGRRGDDGLGEWEGVRQGARITEGGEAITLTQPPTISVDDITTFDLDNVGTTYDPSLYFVDTTDVNQPGRICLNLGSIWPPSLRRRNAFQVTFTAGYAEGNVPPEMVDAMRRMLAYIFNNRGEATEGGAKVSGAYEMLRPFIVSQPMLRNDTNKRYRGM